MIMITGNYNILEKQIHFKAYQELSKLENALEELKEKNISTFQVSIMGKLTQFCNDKDIEFAKDTAIINSYWNGLLGNTVNFGTFYNPESGPVFIVGPLVTIFLHKINGKYLAALSSGTYGIFRGMGSSEAQSAMNLKLLNSGSYLLILRGGNNVLNFL